MSGPTTVGFAPGVFSLAPAFQTNQVSPAPKLMGFFGLDQHQFFHYHGEHMTRDGTHAAGSFCTHVYPTQNNFWCDQREFQHTNKVTP